MIRILAALHVKPSASVPPLWRAAIGNNCRCWSQFRWISTSETAGEEETEHKKPRTIYVAATRQHVGKTSVSLALVSGLQKRYEKVGFIKPVGQQHVPVHSESTGETVRVDKDVVLMREHFKLFHIDYKDMSPVIIPQGYTKEFVRGAILKDSTTLYSDKIHWSREANLVKRQYRRNFSSFSDFGRRAYDVRQKFNASEKERNSYLSSSDNTSIDTFLARCGLRQNAADINEGCASNAPLAPPLEMSTTYERPADGIYPTYGHIYSRTCNPTRKLLEREVASLETFGIKNVSIHHDKICTAYASGMAAVSALLLAYPSAHVLLPDDCYHGTPTLLMVLNQHGISHSAVDMTRLEELISAIEAWKKKKRTDSDGKESTLIVWLESPSNPLTKITDIQAISDAIQQLNCQYTDSKILTFVDSTWAPPNITQPLLALILLYELVHMYTQLGADAVLHSATKYFGGHSDVTLGLVTTSPISSLGQELATNLARIQTVLGSIASPMDCWLCLRGLRTMSVRLERQCESAMDLSIFLQNHPLVQKTYYPGLISHPQHVIAAKQMRKGLFGGMLSFEVADEGMAMAVAGAVSLIKRATSLGGTETLIEHRASIEPVDRVTSPRALLRLSVGLENVNDLKKDLGVALEIADDVVR